MSRDSIHVGELLVKLCELSRSCNVDIRISQYPYSPNTFEIRLDRKDNHAASLIDITRTFKGDLEGTADYVFHRSLYEINKLEKPEDYLKGD